MLWFFVRRRASELVHHAVEVHPKLLPVAPLFVFIQNKDNYFPIFLKKTLCTSMLILLSAFRLTV